MRCSHLSVCVRIVAVYIIWLWHMILLLLIYAGDPTQQLQAGRTVQNHYRPSPVSTIQYNGSFRAPHIGPLASASLCPTENSVLPSSSLVLLLLAYRAGTCDEVLVAERKISCCSWDAVSVAASKPNAQIIGCYRLLCSVSVGMIVF